MIQEEDMETEILHPIPKHNYRQAVRSLLMDDNEIEEDREIFDNDMLERHFYQEGLMTTIHQPSVNKVVQLVIDIIVSSFIGMERVYKNVRALIFV